MIEIDGIKPTASPFAVVFGAAILQGQCPALPQYLPPIEMPYAIQQVQGTFSEFMDGRSARQESLNSLAREISEIYSSLSARQEPLGADFEAAIFSDLEALYEA